tara:strand:- start:354 stop:890 length:537 start_codon:yes stop_codon:yes gene_type:complete
MVIIENNETGSEKRHEAVLAERSQRFYAFVLDALFSFSVSLIIPLILSPLIKNSDLIIALLCFVIIVTIQGYLLINTGQSIGKRLMNIRIVDSINLKIPSFKKVFLIRYILIWQIPNLMSLILLASNSELDASDPSNSEGIISLIAFIVLAQTLLIFKNDRRCGHDILSGTIVEKIIN